MFVIGSPFPISLRSRKERWFTVFKNNWPSLRRRLAQTLTLTVVVGASAAVLAAAPAYADPPCQNGGVYILGARGSSAPIGSAEMKKFRDSVRSHLGGVPSAWAELGNLGGLVPDGQMQTDPSAYRAAGAPWIQPTYGDSVRVGTDELVRHLNDRTVRCPRESVVLGGYSQGADVIGWALERQAGPDPYLTGEAKGHIGFVALYGDPKNNGVGPRQYGCYSPQWVRGNVPCQADQVQGFLGARWPYVPISYSNGFQDRTGSWCDQFDGMCTGNYFDLPNVNPHSTHSGPHSAYLGGNNWIIESGLEVARAALGKLVELNPWLGDWNHDGQPDFFAFDKHDGGSGKTVYFVLNGFNPAQMLQVGATPFAWTDANWSFAPGYDFNRDGLPELYAFNKHGANGKTDYAVLNGRDPGGPPVQSGATAFGWTGANHTFMPGPDWNRDGMWDIYAFNKRDTGSGRTVYFVLDGRDPARFLQIGATAFGWTADNYVFMPGPDWNHDGRPDLYAFDKQDGGSGHSTYFVMDGRDPARLLHVGALPFGWTDGNWEFGVFNG